MKKILVLIGIFTAIGTGVVLWQNNFQATTEEDVSDVPTVDEYKAQLRELRTWDGDPNTNPLGFDRNDPKYQRLTRALKDMQAMRQIGGNYRDHLTQVREMQSARNDFYMTGEFADTVDKSIEHYVNALTNWGRAIDDSDLAHIYESSRDGSFQLADSNLTDALRLAP